MKTSRKYIYRLFIWGVTALLFSSCQLANKYESPAVDTQNLFRGKDTTDTTSIANIPWQQYFNDAALRSLIEEALRNNYDLRIAVTRIKQGEANLTMARAAYFPDIALVGQVQEARHSFENGKKKVLGYHAETYTLGISATWEADIWGKLNRQSRAQYAQYLNSQAYYRLVATSLIANIATSYYTLLAMDKQLEITKETVVLLEETAETMEALKNAGMLNAAAVEQSKSLLYGTQTTIPDLENQVRQLENSIAIMLGRKPDSVYRNSIDVQILPAELKYGVPVQMLTKRPDIQQAELAFRSAFELTNAAQASLYPSLTLNTGSVIGLGSSTLSNFFKPENIILNLLGGITQPIFAKKQLTGQLKIRKAQQEEALLTFEKTVLSASEEVSNILYTYEQSQRKNTTRDLQIESLNKAVEYTHELLKAGVANYTEVLTAEQNLLQAQLSQVNDKLEQLQATVNLYRALGGGVE